MKTKKQMRKLFPIPIIETGSSKMKCVIGSVPLFNTQSESETYVSSMHSQYIQNVLKRNVSYETTFGVYEDEIDGSFKIRRSSFKNNKIHVFVDGRKYKRNSGAVGIVGKV